MTEALIMFFIGFGAMTAVQFWPLLRCALQIWHTTSAHSQRF
jgi:hypothetical protein